MNAMGRGTYYITNQHVAACAGAGNQPSWLSGLRERRHAAVMSRTAKTPVATLADLRGVTPWLWGDLCALPTSHTDGACAVDHPLGC